MAFADNLQKLPAVDGVQAITLKDAAGNIVATIENKPGQAGSLRVYAALAGKYGAITPQAAAEGLDIYAEHTADAKANPGKHPNIDRLIQAIEAGQTLSVERVA